eukprot:PhF_6_TR12599/c0_g1_i2/m.19863
MSSSSKEAIAIIGGRLLPNIPTKDPTEAKQHYKEILQLNKRVQNAMSAEALRISEARKKNADEKDFMQRAQVEWAGILQEWDVREHEARNPNLWSKGLPPSLRPQIWAMVIGNALQIPADMFMLLTLKAQAAQVKLGLVPGSPKNEDDKDRKEAEEEESAVGPRETHREVTFGLGTDLHRTFGHIRYFHDGPLLQTLQDVITAYCLYRPDVGYVQGMSYIAAVLVLHMDAVTSFIAFANILHSRHFPYFFSMDHFAMGKYYGIFDEVLRMNTKEISDKLLEVGVPSSTYLQSWFMTYYSIVLPLPLVPRVWDLMLFSDATFFKVGVTVMKYFERNILDGSHDDVMFFLTHIPRDTIEVNAFMQLMENVVVVESDVERKKREYGIV